MTKAALPEAEQHLREWLWINHGCPVAVLYGDDGEMQCNALGCMLDFKKTPLAELCLQLIAKGHLHAGQRPQWQPIDTAPQDYRVDILVHDASWCGGAPRITVTHWVGYQTRTGEVVEEKGAFIGVTKPTHWMPLPQAPVGGAQ